MDKETLIRLAQLAATFALTRSILTLPFIAKAYGVLQIEGSSRNVNYSLFTSIRLKIID